MKRTLRAMVLAFLCVMLAVPSIDARGRHPGARGNEPGYHHQGGRRPDGNRPPGGRRPDPASRPGGHRPPGGGHGGHRPDPVPRPGGHHHHGPGAYRPHGGPAYMAPPPPRPHRPVYAPWGAPPPPPRAWHPGPRGPYFGSLLGVMLGATVDFTINTLLNSGYNIDGYDNGVLYLNDVSQLGYMWPSAAMMYNSAGGLRGSQFFYSTPYNSTSRFEQVYTTLCSQYGAPTVVSNGTAVWYGNGGIYISLGYGAQAVSQYGTRYFTTLTFGN